MAGPLEGVRVLDCTHVIAGSYCSMLLADLGADVIKIEPLEGEMMRGRPGMGFKPFDFVNRNKRAIAVDLGSDAGAEIIRELAKTADVFVENFRVGALEKRGLGYADLSKVNAGLIYASISGFGQTGPYRDRGGLDLVAQAMSGIMNVTGEAGTDAPMSAGVPLTDFTAGTNLALGISAALRHKEVSGKGQHLETSLLESGLAYTMWETCLFLDTGQVAQRSGTRHRISAPYEALKTRDGHIVVGVSGQKLWFRFCDVLGAPGLAEDPRFAEPHLRLENRDALQQALEAILAADTSENWVRAITAIGVPCGPINNVQQALDDPHVKARGFLVEVDGRKFPRAPLILSETPVELRRGPSEIGADTRAVLAEAGVSEEQIEQLRSQKVIGL